MNPTRALLAALLLLPACAPEYDNDGDTTEESGEETGETDPWMPSGEKEDPNTGDETGGDPDTSDWPDLGERCDNQPYPCLHPYGCRDSGERDEDGHVIGVCGEYDLPKGVSKEPLPSKGGACPITNILGIAPAAGPLTCWPPRTSRLPL